MRYTKGQHKGLGLAVEPPLYVLEKDPAACAIRLGHNEELFTMEVVAGDWNWISIPTLTAPMEFTMKLRYSQKESPAIAEPLADGRVRLRFREAQRAVTRDSSPCFTMGRTLSAAASLKIRRKFHHVLLPCGHTIAVPEKE